jgi:integrase|tara:strand:- start:108 stop:1094 length:987 start_codon:yes stop_codon:yes gene_type:complete
MANIRRRQGRWQAQVRRKGYSQVTKTFTSKEAAKRWIKAVETDMERGEFKPRLDMTVGQLIKRYQTDIIPKQKAHQSALVRCRRLRRMLGKINLSDLSPAHLASYRDERLKSIKPNTLKRELSILSSAINTAIIDWGIPIPSNPVAMTRIPKYDDSRDRRLKDGEEEKLLAIAKPVYRRAIIIAVETAIRRGELLNIRKSHINFDKQTLHIPETKTDTPRTIPLSTRAIKALRDQIKSISDANVVQMERDPKLFSMSSPMFRHEIHKYRVKLDMEDWRFHDLRHEATSRLFERGLNVMEVALVTGHQDLRMLKRYTHLRAEDLVERLG